jgi:hypothetical protein
MRADDIVRNLELLGQELERRGVTGEIVQVGGAVMLLVIGNGQTTKEIDACCATNAQDIRDAALERRISLESHLTIDKLEGRYRSTNDPVERSRWHFLWLLARGLTAKGATWSALCLPPPGTPCGISRRP